MRRRRTLAFVGAAAALGAAVGAGVVFARGNSHPAKAAPSATSAVGAVEVRGTDPVTGKRVDLASFSGKPVVINIWASWCPGCNQEAADLARFARAHQDAQVVGVDIEDTRGDARAFYRHWGWHHPSVFDPQGSIAARLGLQGLPTTIFLDARHRPVARIVGASNLTGFADGLRKAEAASAGV